MARFKKIPQKQREGKIIYGDGIIDGIVLLALREIPFVELYSPTYWKKMYNNSIKVEILKDGAHIDITVKIHYTQSVSDVAFKIQEAVRHNVEAMTEYKIANVNVNIMGVMFDEVQPVKPQETQEQQDTQQEG